MKSLLNAWLDKTRYTMPVLFLSFGLLLEEIVGRLAFVEAWTVWAMIISVIVIWSFPYGSLAKSARFRSQFGYLEKLASLMSDEAQADIMKSMT